MADTRLHNRSYEQADQFDRHSGVGNVIRGVDIVTGTRGLSQLVVTIAGAVGGSRMGGEIPKTWPGAPCKHNVACSLNHIMNHHPLRSAGSPIARPSIDSHYASISV